MNYSWQCFHVSCCPHTHPPKDKYVVIVCAASDPMGFLVNSQVGDFVLNRPDMRACQVALKKEDYWWLSHDSFLDCSQLYPFEDDHLGNGRGPIKAHTVAEIKNVVASAKTIEKRYKELISNA